ncbi:MAG: protein kinase [Holophagales bacterium]|nr:protein kinase [Holophagales bacterium]
MVTDSGLVKILDFGLARFVDPSPVAEGEETKRSYAAGRRPVLARTCPEQAEGRGVDPRSDIFSFGAVLYEMVTGQKAFARASPSATIAAVLRDEPKPAREVSGEIPPELDRVISRCLRKDPARRFQSMADLKVTLEELLDGPGSESTTRGVGVGSAWRAVVGATAAVLLVAAVAGTWLVRRRMTDDVEPTRPLPLTSFGGRILWPALSPDGNQVAFAWNGEAQESFDLYEARRSWSSDTPDERPGHGVVPAWSPDGRQIAFLRNWRRDARFSP